MEIPTVKSAVEPAARGPYGVSLIEGFGEEAHLGDQFENLFGFHTQSLSNLLRLKTVAMQTQYMGRESVVIIVPLFLNQCVQLDEPFTLRPMFIIQSAACGNPGSG